MNLQDAQELLQTQQTVHTNSDDIKFLLWLINEKTDIDLANAYDQYRNELQQQEDSNANENIEA